MRAVVQQVSGGCSASTGDGLGGSGGVSHIWTSLFFTRSVLTSLSGLQRSYALLLRILLLPLWDLDKSSWETSDKMKTIDHARG